ncbi:MAG TPA: hypothetical protein VF598_00250 [Hymenobacter sp.]
MTNNEFRSAAELVKRDSNGALCQFAVVSDRGDVVLGLSWAEACNQAEEYNALELDCLECVA